MRHGYTTPVVVESDDTFYDPHGWATTSGFPVAVLDGQQEHFVMRRFQDGAVRLKYELPQGSAYLTSYPRALERGHSLELMEGSLSKLTAPYACRPLRLREKGERIAVDREMRDCVFAILAPRRWWLGSHARIGKAVEHEGRTVILIAPLVGGRKLQLTTVPPG